MIFKSKMFCQALGLKFIQCFLLLLVKRTSQKMISYKLIRLMPVNKPSVPPERQTMKLLSFEILNSNFHK